MITFEKITANEYRSKAESGLLNLVFSGFRRWAIAPVAAVVIVLWLSLAPRYGNITADRTAITVEDSYDWSWNELVSLADDSGLWSTVVETFVEDDSEFDLMADELPLEFEDALESLTDEELNILYERIDKLNGSVS